MSLGPQRSEKTEVIGLGGFRHQVKKITEEYFKDPLHYLLYGSLALAIIGLFLGMKFSWEFYGLLLIFAGIKTYRFFSGKNGAAK